MKSSAVLLAVSLLSLPKGARAAAPAPQPATSHKADEITIPQMLSYQGRLTDSLGNPVADTLYAVRFRLYAQPSGGTQFWEESQQVRTKSGLFSVLLGSVAPIGSMPDVGTVFLGMTVSGGAELAPRLRIASAAYAYKADTAGFALAAGSADGAWARGLPDSVLFTVNQLGVARGKASNMLHGSSRHTHVNLGVACTTGTPGQDWSSCTVSGGLANTAADEGAVVAGGSGNIAAASYATVSGGGANAATYSHATVAGGRHNVASAANAAVGGGKFGVASGYCATVAGGLDNVASGSNATVGGGSGNVANGEYATIPGGGFNAARGSYSHAAGGFARANHAGSFVWGDSSDADDSVYTTSANQWRVRAQGGTWFFSNQAMTTGAYLPPGSNSWASACDSANKEDFREVDRQDLLARLAALRMHDYKMRDQDDGTRHIGPMAQDFYGAFGYGESNTSINLADADGVALAAIQALYEDNRALRAEVEKLKAELRRK